MDDARMDLTHIQEDHAFFMDHSTEAVRELQGYRSFLADSSLPTSSCGFLDFGCGPGGFTERFLAAPGAGPETLRMSLVELISDDPAAAASRLQGFSQSPLETSEALPCERRLSFDLTFSNPVSYYEPALDEALVALRNPLRLGGRVVVAIAGRGNTPVDFWFRSFPWPGMALPYHTAEDVDASLPRSGARYRSQQVP